MKDVSDLRMTSGQSPSDRVRHVKAYDLQDLRKM